MNGGPSQVDTFDPKPLLDKYHGKPLPAPNLRTERKTGRRHALAVHVPAVRQERHRGQRAVRPHGRAHIDDMCVIRSMHADVPNHEPSLMLMNCGDGRLPRPSIGSWVTYGLGSENQNLPGFIAMCPGGYPIVGHAELALRLPARRLPGHATSTPSTPTSTQADREHPQHRRHARRAAPPARPACAASTSSTWQRAATTPQLEARIQSFELAYRMQTEADRRLRPQPRAASPSASCTAPASHGRQLLITRRLLERGVRVVQVWSGGRAAVGQPRRPRSSTPQAGRPAGTSPSPPSSTTSRRAACSTARWCCGAASSAARRSPSCPA